MNNSLSASQYTSNYLPPNNFSYVSPAFVVTSPGVPSQDYSANSQFYTISNVVPSTKNLSSSQYIPDYKTIQVNTNTTKELFTEATPVLTNQTILD